MCPNCRQNAPIIYRGALAYCTACNGPRPPFSAKSINLAGRASRVGGTVATAFGWLTMVVGLVLAASITWFLQLIVGGMVGWAVGVPIALIAVVTSIVMVLGGGRWRRQGVAVEEATLMEAAYSMALHRGGAVTALDVSRTLNVPIERADRMLTDMIKTHPDYVSVEFDEQGQVFYRLAGVPGAPEPGLRQYRVQEDGRVRIEDALTDVAATEAQEESRQRR